MVESWLSVWARRVVSIPCVFTLSAVAVAALPAWLAMAALIDVGTRSKRWPKTRALLFFTLYLTCETVGVISAFVVWAVSLGGGPRQLQRNAALQRYFSDALFFGAVRIFSMKVQVSGHMQAAPFLLFVRHASTADTVLAAALLANRQRIIMRYVLKRELLWDPCIDIVGRRLPNAFVERGKKTGADIAALVSLTAKLDEQSAVLIFPEGTRFSPQHLTSARRKLADQGHTALLGIANNYRNVLPPKLGGPLALLEAAPELDVVFLEHVGFEGARSFDRFVAGDLIGRTIHVRFRRVAVGAIPKADRAEWLFEQWRLCDQFVSSHLGEPT